MHRSACSGDAAGLRRAACTRVGGGKKNTEPIEQHHTIISREPFLFLALFLRVAVLAASEHGILLVAWRAPRSPRCFAESSGVLGRFGRWVIAPSGLREVPRAPGGCLEPAFALVLLLGVGYRGQLHVVGGRAAPEDGSVPARRRLHEGGGRETSAQQASRNARCHLRASAEPELHPARKILLLGCHAKEAPARCSARGWESLLFHTKLCTILCLFIYLFFLCKLQ